MFLSERKFQLFFLERAIFFSCYILWVLSLEEGGLGGMIPFDFLILERSYKRKIILEIVEIELSIDTFCDNNK